MATNRFFPAYIGRRLSLGADGSKSAPAVKVAITAVALSVAVMLAALAIVNGFKREIRQKVVGFNSHLTIYADVENLPDGEQPLVSLTPSLKKILDEEPYIKSYSLEISVPSVLKTDKDFKGIYFRGRDNYSSYDFLRDNLVAGSLQPASPDTGAYMAISQKAADRLNLKPGDRIDTYFIADDIKVRPMKVQAIFNSRFDAYDDVYAYGSLAAVQDVTGISKSEGSALSIMTDDFDRVDEYAQRLQQRLNAAYMGSEVFRLYRVETVNRQGAGYFQWLSLLDTNVIVVLILMAVVACVTLISGILILILDKFRFIGTIKALGASNKCVRRIFLYLAMKVAVAGVVIGNVVMLLLLWLQHQYRFLPLDPESYYIDFVPVEMSWGAFGLLNVVVLVLIFVTLLLPARFVSTISPSVTMRYE